jgi:hypothetical protein
MSLPAGAPSGDACHLQSLPALPSTRARPCPPATCCASTRSTPQPPSCCPATTRATAARTTRRSRPRRCRVRCGGEWDVSCTRQCRLPRWTRHAAPMRPRANAPSNAPQPPPLLPPDGAIIEAWQQLKMVNPLIQLHTEMMQPADMAYLSPLTPLAGVKMLQACTPGLVRAGPGRDAGGRRGSLAVHTPAPASKASRPVSEAQSALSPFPHSSTPRWACALPTCRALCSSPRRWTA